MSNTNVYQSILQKLDRNIEEMQSASREYLANDSRILCLTMEEVQVLRNHLFNSLQNVQNN